MMATVYRVFVRQSRRGICYCIQFRNPCTVRKGLFMHIRRGLLHPYFAFFCFFWPLLTVPEQTPFARSERFFVDIRGILL